MILSIAGCSSMSEVDLQAIGSYTELPGLYSENTIILKAITNNAIKDAIRNCKLIRKAISKWKSLETPSLKAKLS